MKQIKIIVLGTRGFPNVQGGVETHCENLYPVLASLGCQVVVLARHSYVGTKSYQYRGVDILPLSCSRSKFLEAFFHTFIGVFKAKKLGCDILHIHAVGPSLFTLLAKILGLTVVVTHHGPDYKRKKWNWFAKIILRFGEYVGIKTADHVICISQTIAEDIKKKYGRTSSVIPNGVNIPRICLGADFLQEKQVEKGRYFLAVGRFVPEKGFDDLVNAFVVSDTLISSGYKLVIVGDSDHEDAYSQMIKARTSNNKNIVLTGFLTGRALEELYSHAGCFVLPSYYEGLPIVLLEAMSYGLQCIASDIPANRILKLDEGCYFKHGDVDGLSNKFKLACQNPISAEEKKEQIEYIRKNYNWENIAQETFKVYRDVKERR
ncbi:MAG: glycosyltransferase family 4 protein [Candidatus Aceula meridiana]|nr:glycosyltransferase family 4 protein [Candidatus Aceula meridiana]